MPRDRPLHVIHADWSVQPRKRWCCEATRTGADGAERWRVAAPIGVGDVDAWVEALCRRVEGGATIALGLDLPIGLPAAYAECCGVDDFRSLLPELGRGRWHDFYRVAERAEEVSLRRPFFPRSSRGGVRRSDLVDGLGMASYEALLRRCDRATPHRGAACCLFWTLGAQQVGKAAIAGWRRAVVPLLERLGDRAAVWPFDGRWHALLRRRSLVIAETYPAEFYARLGFPRGGWSKRDPEDRRRRFGQLARWTRGRPITLTAALRRRGEAGFAPGGDGEDSFDSAVGAVGMVGCLTGAIEAPEPARPATRRTEGWILGRPLRS